MKFAELRFKILLYGAKFWMNRNAWKYPSFKERFKEKNFTAQIKAIVEAEHEQDNEGILEKDLTKLKRKIKAYHVEERELLSLFRHKEIDRDCLLDEINQLKKEQERDEQRLTELTHNKEVLSDMRDMEVKLTEYCQTVTMNLSNCDFETKRLALKALGIKVTASSGIIDIQGAIPIEIKDTNLAMSANATSWVCMCVGNQGQPLQNKTPETTLPH